MEKLITTSKNTNDKNEIPSPVFMEILNFMYRVKRKQHYYIPLKAEEVIDILTFYGIDLTEIDNDIAKFDDIAFHTIKKHLLMMWEKYRYLPDSWTKHYIYLSDCGHSINCVIFSLIQDLPCGSDLYEYTAPIPVRYVIEKGPGEIEGHLIIDAPYRDEVGVYIFGYSDY